MKKIYILITAAILLIILIGGSLLFHKNVSQKGSVQIIFNLPNTSSLKMSLNNEPLKITGLQDTYHIAPGSYQLTITQSDYNDFSTSFDLKLNQPIVINAALKPKITATLDNARELTAALGDTTNTQLSDVTYFFSNTWAAANIEVDGGDSAVIIVKYDTAKGQWDLVFGPGTFFSPKDIASLPPTVKSYLKSTPYYSEDSQ